MSYIREYVCHLVSISQIITGVSKGRIVAPACDQGFKTLYDKTKRSIAHELMKYFESIYPNESTIFFIFKYALYLDKRKTQFIDATY